MIKTYKSKHVRYKLYRALFTNVYSASVLNPDERKAQYFATDFCPTVTLEFDQIKTKHYVLNPQLFGMQFYEVCIKVSLFTNSKVIDHKDVMNDIYSAIWNQNDLDISRIDVSPSTFNHDLGVFVTDFLVYVNTVECAESGEYESTLIY